MRFILSILQFFLTLSLFGLMAVGGAVFYANKLFTDPGPLKQEAIFSIKRGQGLSSIARGLEAQKIIQNQFVFSKVVQHYYKATRKLKAGEYAIPKDASMKNVLDILIDGKAILYKVTLPEGRTSLQVVNILRGTANLTGEIAEIPPEGSLLPDTYSFTRNESRQSILNRMRKAQESFLDKVWTGRLQGLPIKTRQDAVILASIVEKETGVAGERRHIAGVFVNRLRRGMRLQSDPTIIYGLVGGKGSLGHPIRLSELRKKTAYNTYQIDGLTPTPITNPGRKAIAAVLNPAETDDLFFVADGSGGHVFAATLAGHQRNVKNWRKVEKKNRAREREQEKRAAEAAAQSAPKITNISATQPVAENQEIAPATSNGWPVKVPPPVRKAVPRQAQR